MAKVAKSGGYTTVKDSQRKTARSSRGDQSNHGFDIILPALPGVTEPVEADVPEFRLKGYYGQYVMPVQT